MSKIVTIAALLLLAGTVSCSGSPTPTDVPPAKQTADHSTAHGPIEVLEAWLDSEDAPAELALLLGETPRIERVWKEGDYYRAVVIDPSSPAATAEGEAVLITLRPSGRTWEVAIAEVGPASTLWPAL